MTRTPARLTRIPEGHADVRWGNYSLADGWPPANINSGAIYAGGGTIRANGPWSVGIDYLDSSNQLISHAFGAVVSQIDSGVFPISLSLCSPYCQYGVNTRYGPITLASLTVELKGAEVATPGPASWILMLSGLVGTLLVANAISCQRRWPGAL